MVRRSGARATASDLARAVRDTLTTRRARCPSLTNLVELLHVVHDASLETDERRPAQLQVAWIDPADPDPDAPPHIRGDRWQWIPVEPREAFNTPNIAKIAAATDPRSTTVGVFGRRGSLDICGLVDQQGLMHNFLYRDDQHVYPPAGQLAVRVEGPAHIRVYWAMSKIAELRHGVLLGPSVDVFSKGPILSALLPGFEAILASVWVELKNPPAYIRREWRGPIQEQWISAICRTLLRTDGYRHGGAFVVTPDVGIGTNAKHRIDYGRLRAAIIRQATHTVGMAVFYEEIDIEYLMPGRTEMPVIDWLDYEIERDELEDCVRELDGTTRFISLLTQVDGAVLMTPSLEVKGFGVEITKDDPPPSLVIAGDRTASKRRLAPADYNHYGTRHRSMMRYCWSVPGSVGLVISSDGGVRAMTRVGSDVVMWQDVQLHHEWDFDPAAAARLRRLRNRIKKGSGGAKTA